MDFSLLQEFKNPKIMTLKVLISDAIRSAIIQGKLKPGQQLQQDKIADSFGVSIIPVREAFSSLMEEGHIVYHTNRGVFVSEIDAEKVREIYEIRFFLESGALSLSLPKFQQKDLEDAERLILLESEETDAKERVRLDLAYHLALCRPCGRPHLLKLIEQIQSHVERYVNLSVYLMNFKRHPEYNHLIILEACKKRSFEQVKSALKNHFKIATDLICKNFDS